MESFRVLDEATLPCLIPALLTVLATLEDQEPTAAEELVRFVADDRLVRLRPVVEQVIEAASLVLLRRDGRWRWSAVGRTVRVHRVPERLANNQMLSSWMEGALPALYLVRADAASLCRSDRNETWASEQLAAFLDRVDLNVVREDEELAGALAAGIREIFDRFVDPRARPALRQLVAKLVAGIIEAGGYDRLHEARPRWEPVLSLLDKERTCFLGGRDRAGPSVRRLAKEYTLGDLLVLPESLLPQGWTSASGLALDLARATLRKLIAVVKSDQESGVLDSARFMLGGVVRLVGASQVKDDPDLGAEPFVRCWSTSKKDVVISIADLVAAEATGRVVASRGQPLQSAAEIVSRVLGGAEVMLLGPDLEALSADIKPMGWPAVAAMLRSHDADLGTQDDRVALLQWLLKPGVVSVDLSIDVRTRRAFRFLLHGCANQRHDDEPLFYRIDEAKLSERAMRDALEVVGRPHALLDPGTVSHLSVQILSQAGVDALSDRKTLDLVMGLAIKPTDCVRLAEATRQELLAAAPDDETWRRLPLHLLHGGGFTKIEEGVFGPGSAPMPAGLSDAVRILACATNVSFEARLARVPVWDSEALVRTAIRQREPHRFCADILRALSDLGAESRVGLRNELAERPWMAVRQAGLVPHRVLSLPQALERRVSEMFSERQDLAPPLPSDLSGIGVAEDSLIQWMRECLFLAGEAAFDSLGSAFDRLPRDQRASWMVLPAWDLDLLNGVLNLPPIPSPGCGWEILRAMQLQEGTEPAAVPSFTRHLIGPVSAELQRAALLALSEHTSTADPAQRERALGLFNRLLGALATGHEFDAHVLPEILLPAQDGSWRHANEIARHGAGLAPRFRLHEDACAHLARLTGAEERLEDDTVGNGPKGQPQPADLEQVGAHLRELLEPWRAIIHDTPLLVLLSLLGSRHEIEDYAMSLDRGHSLTWARSKLVEMHEDNEALRPELDRSLQFGIHLCQEGQQVLTLALNGDLLEATTDAGVPRVLLIGEVSFGPHPRWLQLRRYSPTSRTEALSILKETVRQVARARGLRVGSRGFGAVRFDDWWEREVCIPAQAELGPQISRLVAELPSQLRVLGSMESNEIREALREFEEADLRLREATAMDAWASAGTDLF